MCHRWVTFVRVQYYIQVSNVISPVRGSQSFDIVKVHGCSTLHQNGQYIFTWIREPVFIEPVRQQFIKDKALCI